MNAYTSHGEAQHRGSAPVPPAAIWARWMLGIAAVVAGTAFLYTGFLHIRQGCMMALEGIFYVLFVGLPLLLLLGIPSLLVARKLARDPDRGVRAAFIFDALALISATILALVLSMLFCVSGGSSLSGLELTNAAIGIFALLFGAEAAWLARAVRGRTRAWRELGCFAVAIALIGIAAPFAANTVRLRHVQPLVRYISAHWVDIDDGFQLTVERRSVASQQHQDVVHAYRQERFWPPRGFAYSFYAPHEKGRWRFPSDTEIAFCGWGDMRKIPNATAARAHLREMGVVDRQLSDAGISTKGEYREKYMKEYMKQYLVNSPLAGGVYAVGKFDGLVSLSLSQPLAVADHP